MIPHKKRYFAIIVHYGDPDKTSQLLRSLISPSSPLKEIILVDHAPQPYRTQELVNVFGVRPHENRGYATGINLGLGVLLSRGVEASDIVVCMNNDVEIEPSTLQTLHDWWEQHPEPALAGAKAGSVNLFSGRVHILASYPLPPASYILPYIHGSFFSAPYKVFMQLQGLPEQYFLYWEDTLVSLRARQRAIPLHVIPDLTVKHQDQTYPQPGDDKLYYLVRNGALFLEHETACGWRAYWWVKNRLRLVWHTLRSRRGRAPLIRRALWDAVRGKTGRREL